MKKSRGQRQQLDGNTAPRVYLNSSFFKIDFRLILFVEIWVKTVDLYVLTPQSCGYKMRSRIADLREYCCQSLGI